MVRLFVAVYPPLDAARAMAGALESVELGQHRATPIEQVHLTLQFVGDTPGPRVDDVAETVGRACGGIDAFTLTPIRLITLPERGSPRLLAMQTDAPPPLLEMQRRLASRLARRARRNAGDRFLPHLTLCRFREGAHPARIETDVELPAFGVSEVKVMRSVLRTTGSEHAEVRRVPLGT